MHDTTAFRTESDAFGPVSIPADRYWGAQTQRALGVFAIGTERLPACVVHAFGIQKQAAAAANLRCGTLAPALAAPIVQAAQEVQQGRFDEHFPLPVWQTGSGTQTNMNANEVIANRANQLLGQPLGTRQPVHPNDHVNASQSSNDSFPTVLHIATALELRDRLRPALAELAVELRGSAQAFHDVLRVARTHCMDAVPMTMGQAFSTFVRQVEQGMARLDDCLPRLCLLPQGGTAVGTGLNAPAGFDAAFCDEASRITRLALEPNPCKFEGMAVHDALVEVSGALNTLASSLCKMANDIRLLGSGPRCGLGELQIPDDGLSSSIMPGKRNATIAEALVQACLQTMGNHATVTMANASGSFELNVAKPVLGYNLLQSIRLLADASQVFAQRLVRALEVDHARLATNTSHALLAVTALNPVLGYDQVAAIVRSAVAQGCTPREAALASGLLSAQDYDRHVDLRRLARPHG